MIWLILLFINGVLFYSSISFCRKKILLNDLNIWNVRLYGGDFITDTAAVENPRLWQARIVEITTNKTFAGVGPRALSSPNQELTKISPRASVPLLLHAAGPRIRLRSARERTRAPPPKNLVASASNRWPGSRPSTRTSTFGAVASRKFCIFFITFGLHLRIVLGLFS